MILLKQEERRWTVKTRKLTQMALLTAIALTIFMVEAQIPALVPVPGVKLGLSNIITVFAVFAMGSREAAAILFVRIFLGAVFAGNFSTIFYSAAGGALARRSSFGWRVSLAPLPTASVRWQWPLPLHRQWDLFPICR